MQRLRAADEPDRGHAEAEFVHRPRCGGDDIRMVGEAEIIVGAKIERLAGAVLRGDADPPALRSRQQALALRQARRLDVVERRANVPENASDMAIRRMDSERIEHNSAPGAIKRPSR